MNIELSISFIFEMKIILMLTLICTVWWLIWVDSHCGSYTIDIEISAKWSNKCFAWIIYFAILPVNCFEGVWIASFLILPLRGRVEFYDTYIQRCNSKMFKSVWFHLSVGKKDKNYHEKKTLKLIKNILFWLCFFLM